MLRKWKALPHHWCPLPHFVGDFWQNKTQPKHFPWCLRSSEWLKMDGLPREAQLAAGVAFICLVNAIFYLYIWRNLVLGCTNCLPEGFCCLLPAPCNAWMIWAPLSCQGVQIVCARSAQHPGLGPHTILCLPLFNLAPSQLTLGIAVCLRLVWLCKAVLHRVVVFPSFQ